MNPFTSLFFHILTLFTIVTHHTVAVQLKSAQQIPPTPTVMQKMLVATTTVTKFGQTLKVTARFPQNGGAITGAISGACTGTIAGNYTGELEGKKLQGTGTASCPVFFMTIAGTASFSGIVDATDTAGTITYVGNSSNNQETGTYTFPLSLQ